MEMSMGILLYLDLEFWEWTLKTLTPSLQEKAIYFTTRSYLTLTKHQYIVQEKFKQGKRCCACSKAWNSLKN